MLNLSVDLSDLWFTSGS